MFPAFIYPHSGTSLRLKIYMAVCNFFDTFFVRKESYPESNCCFRNGVPSIRTPKTRRATRGENMEPAFITYARQLCKTVAEEANPERVKDLLEQLAQVIDEHQLLASLL